MSYPKRVAFNVPVSTLECLSILCDIHMYCLDSTPSGDVLLELSTRFMSY